MVTVSQDKHPFLVALLAASHALLAARVGDWIVLLAVFYAFCFYLGDGKLWGQPDKNQYKWYEAPQNKGDLQNKPKRTRDIGQKLQEVACDIAVLWGSQSGVSEAFAERLARRWQSRFALATLVANLDDYDASSLTRIPTGKLCVFLCSSYGEGDPPDNAVNFCAALENMTKRGTRVDGLRYLALGMGNKNYKHYNQTIINLDSTLHALGALRVGPLGLADESQATTEDDFMGWQDVVLESLGEILPLKERPITYESALNVLDVCVDEQSLWMGEPSEAALLEKTAKVAYNSKNPYAAPIEVSKILCPVSDRVCLHMEISIASAPALRYQTGDHLAVWPSNPKIEVERLLRLLGLDDPSNRSRPIMIEACSGTSSQLNLPSPTTREALLEYYLEICAPVPRDLLVLMSLFAPTEAARAELLRLSGDKAAFRTEVGKRYATLGRVMETVAPGHVWSQVPFSLMIESFSRIQPRYYSISSSPLVQPRQPTITIAVTSRMLSPQEPASSEDKFLGVASNLLLAHDRSIAVRDTQDLNVERSQSQYHAFVPSYDLDGPRSKLSGARIYMHLRGTGFKLPSNPVIPIIMVAAGTGIAPFRGFVQERARLAELGKPVGKMLLFFGCRDDDHDYLYKEEWKARTAQLGDDFIMMPCFSRIPTQKKTYVQDGLAEQKKLVVEMINDGAAFYICGAAAMARDVRARLAQLMAESKGQSLDEADNWINAMMRKVGLYHEDVWG